MTVLKMIKEYVHLSCHGLKTMFDVSSDVDYVHLSACLNSLLFVVETSPELKREQEEE